MNEVVLWDKERRIATFIVVENMCELVVVEFIYEFDTVDDLLFLNLFMNLWLLLIDGQSSQKRGYGFMKTKNKVRTKE